MGGFCRQVFSSYDRLSSEESLDEAGGRKHLETEKAACNGYYHRILLHLKPFESLIIELPPGNEEAF